MPTEGETGEGVQDGVFRRRSGSFAWDDSTDPGSGIAEKRVQEIETLKAQCEDLQSKLWEADRRIAEMVEQIDRLPVLD